MPDETTSTQAQDLTIEALFANAEAEVEGLATDTDAESLSPEDNADALVVDEQSDDDDEGLDDEQAVETEDEFSFDVEDDDSNTAGDVLPETVEVPGHGEVPFGELRDGYLRQSDYTKKTQELAAERKAFADEQAAAAKIMDSLSDDPVGVAAYLAVQTGLLTEDQLNGKLIADLRDTVKIPKASELEAEIAKRVEEAVSEHPRVKEAQAKAVQAEIDGEFEDIAKVVGKPLSEKARTQVMDYAYKHDIMDLRVAFDALSASAARKRASRTTLEAASTERPKTRGSALEGKPKAIDTIEDSFAQALSEHGES